MADQTQQPKRGRGRPPGSGRHPYSLGPRAAAAVAAYLRCGDQRQALRESGYSESYASKFFRVHAVAEAVNAARQAVQIKAEYNLEVAMADLRAAANFAKATKNATALVRAHELMMKLHGLLIERLDQRQVGGFTIAISGIDDEPAPSTEKPAPTNQDVFAAL